MNSDLLKGISLVAATTPQITNVHTSKDVFNPKEEWVALYWDLANSSANVSVYIYDPTDGSTSPIRTLMYPTYRNPGSDNVSWDGKYQGNYVDAGTYTYKILATTNTGERDEATGNIVVSYTPVGTAPVVGSTSGNDSNDYASPNPFDPNTQTTTLHYNVSPQAGVTVKVEVYNNSSAVGTPVETLTNPGYETAVWDGKNNSNTAFPEGTYTYKITATSQFGENTETGTVTVKYAEEPNLIPNVTNDYASPSPFDPYTQTTTVNYTLDRNADVTVEVLDGNTVVKTLLNNATRNAGSNSVVWDGTNLSGTMLSEGAYTYRVTACNSNNECDRETGTVSISYAVDTTAPTVTNDYASPTPFDPHTQTTTVNFTLDKISVVTVSVLDGNTTVTTLFSNVGHPAGNYSTKWDGRNTSGTILSEGTYTYKIVACNINDLTKCDTETGNVVVTYAIDTTSPSITNDYASPSPFDPQTQTTNVHYTLDKTADVTVKQC